MTHIAVRRDFYVQGVFPAVMRQGVERGGVGFDKDEHLGGEGGGVTDFQGRRGGGGGWQPDGFDVVKARHEPAVGLGVDAGEIENGEQKAAIEPTRAHEYLADGFEPVAGVDPFVDPARAHKASVVGEGAALAGQILRQGARDLASEVEVEAVAVSAEKTQQRIARDRAKTRRGVFVLHVGEDRAGGAHIERAEAGGDGEPVVVAHHPGGGEAGGFCGDGEPSKLAGEFVQSGVALDQADGGFAVE